MDLKTLVFVAVLTIAGCGDSDGVSFEEKPKEPKPTEAPTQPPAPAPKPKPTANEVGGGNPICDGEQKFSGNRNRWKARSDSNGKCVFLIDHSFKKKFDGCAVEVRGGQEFEEMVFTGFSNGWPIGENERQTWRCLHTADFYEKKGLISCSSRKQKCRFRLPGTPKRDYGS